MTRTILFLARSMFAGAVLVTTYGAFAPVGAARPHLFPWDKAEHFSAFFSLTVLGLVAFPKLKVLWLSLGLSAAGAAIELIQATPWVARDADVFDWVADSCAIGAVLVVLACERLRRVACCDGINPQPASTSGLHSSVK